MMSRPMTLVVLAFSFLCFASLAQAGPAQHRASPAELPAPNGDQPGPTWVEIVPVSSFSNPSFDWIKGTPSGDGCSFAGRAEYPAGVPRTQMVGVWRDTASCTLEVMNGTPTPEFIARMQFPSSGGSAPIVPGTPTARKPATKSTTARGRTPSAHKRLLWDHVESQGFYAIDAYQYNVGVIDQLSWNGTWSSSCNAYDTTYYNGIEWGLANSTSGGTCWAGIPSWDAGNHWDITEAAAYWNSNIYNGHGSCGTSGATANWWTKLFGRGSGTVVEWDLTTGGSCGYFMSPYLQ